MARKYMKVAQPAEIQTSSKDGVLRDQKPAQPLDLARKARPAASGIPANCDQPRRISAFPPLPSGRAAEAERLPRAVRGAGNSARRIAAIRFVR